jgi:glycosyltransferase involved in cell wall biosynthesis
VNDVERYYQRAGLFVLSSHFEGFPNALCEAMAHGIAVISTDCPSGPREIIDHGENGVLVPMDDIEALARAMERLMLDDKERVRIGQAAVKIIERYSLNRIMDMWERLLEEQA